MEIYEYVVKDLDSNFVCQISGICPSPGKAIQVRNTIAFYK